MTMKVMKTMMRITDNQHKIIKEKFVEEYPKLIWIRIKRFLKQSIRKSRQGT